jgi:uncharacterized protein (UPF0335 family)
MPPFARALGFCLVLLVGSVAREAAAESRVALVVGNSAYAHSTTLANPQNDAKDIAEALKGAGFDVHLGLDLEKRDFDRKIRDFTRALAKADVALLFYAGHGLQVSGRNYLIPVDARIEGERDLDFEGVQLDFILKQMELERDGRTSIVLLDACRDNPLARNLARTMGTRSAAVGQGLAQVQTGVGTFIAYATQPGNVALDGQGRNSPFTAALVKAISVPGRTLTAVMVDVRKQVLSSTGGKQVPWDHSALTGDFYFHRAAVTGSIPKTGPQAPSDMQERLRKLEEELSKKSDPKQTTDLVRLAQWRERVRQLEEANKTDQRRIFDVMSDRSSDPDASRKRSMEIGRIQMEMSRRNQEMKRLREDMAKLEGELGVTPEPAARQR